MSEEKLAEMETKFASLEKKLADLEAENADLRQAATGRAPKRNKPDYDSPKISDDNLQILDSLPDLDPQTKALIIAMSGMMNTFARSIISAFETSLTRLFDVHEQSMGRLFQGMMQQSSRQTFAQFDYARDQDLDRAEREEKKLGAVIVGLKEETTPSETIQNDKEVVKQMASDIGITEDSVGAVFRDSFRPQDNSRPPVLKIRFVDYKDRCHFLAHGSGALQKQFPSLSFKDRPFVREDRSRWQRMQARLDYDRRQQPSGTEGSSSSYGRPNFNHGRRNSFVGRGAGKPNRF